MRVIIKYLRDMINKLAIYWLDFTELNRRRIILTAVILRSKYLPGYAQLNLQRGAK